MIGTTRYKGIPKQYKDLLLQGETQGVEFKRELPNSGLGQLIAAAANTVAIEEAIDEYIILIGVEEVEF